MKRSQVVRLSSMNKNWHHPVVRPATAIIAGIMLSGCDDDQEATIYQNVGDCIQDNPEYSENCQNAYEFALEEAERTGPKYGQMSSCEAEFGYGNCVESRNSSWFMPAMAGFMFGRLLDNDRPYYSQPMYSSRYRGSIFYDRWVTADGYDYGRTGYRNTKVRVPREQTKPKPTVKRTISRGGFGSSVSAKSGWGSSSSKSRSWGG